MKNNGLPDSKEWDKIVDDAFSSTEQHDFSVRYELKKAEIQKGITMSKTTNYIQRRYAGMVAAAAAIVIAVPVSVYAFSNGKTTGPQTEVTTTEATPQETTAAGTASIEPTTLTESSEDIKDKLSVVKNAEYQYIIKFTPTEEAASDTQKYNVEYTFLPNDFIKTDDSLHDYYITSTNGDLSLYHYRVSSETPVNEKIDNIVNCEAIDEDNIDAYILYRSSFPNDTDESTSFSPRCVYVHFKGTNFITQIYASEDITDDDLHSIIKGMKLVPSDSEKSSPWVGNEYPDNISTSSDSTAETYSTDMLKKLNFGDTVSFELDWYEKGKHNLELTLNNAWIQDNFDGINTDICGQPKDFSEYLGNDGKIHDTINWVKYGDGINTLDETVKTEEVELKVVVLDLTYTNNSSFDFINDYDDGGENNALTICPEVFNFPNNSVKDFFVFDDEPTPYNTMPINNNSTFSIATNNKTSKYSIDLLAGKSTHVKMACLVRADQINDTYIDLFGYGCENTNDYIEKDYFLPVKSIK